MIELTNGVQISEDRLIQKATASVDSMSSTGKLEIMQYDDKMPVAAVTLTSKAVTWTPPEGSALRVRMGKPDGHGVLNDALGMDADGTVYFAFTRQMTAAYGMASAAIEVEADGGIKASAPFVVEVRKNPVQDDHIQSGDEYLSMAQILAQAQTVAAQAEAVSKTVSAAQTATAANAQAAAASAAQAQKIAQGIGIDDAAVGPGKLWSSQKSVTTFAPAAAVLAVSGQGAELARLSPTVAWPMRGLVLQGRTTQAAAPSPTAPAPLQHTGASGTLPVTALGRNLVPDQGWVGNSNTISGLAQDGGSLSFTIARTTENSGVFVAAPLAFRGSVRLSAQVKVSTAAFNYMKVSALGSAYQIVAADQFTPGQFTPVSLTGLTANGNVTSMYFSGMPEGSTVEIRELMIAEAGDTGAYQPYTVSTAALPIPGGLPGIPVTEGGNWTDSAGQQWLCDEADLAAGQILHRLAVAELDGTEEWTPTGTAVDRYFIPLPNTGVMGLCNYFDGALGGEAVGGMSLNANYVGFAYTAKGQSNVTEWKNFLKEKKQQGTPLQVLYQPKQPTTEPLPAQVLAAFAALESAGGTTWVGADCGIRATAVADANTYFDQKITELSAAILGG